MLHHCDIYKKNIKNDILEAKNFISAQKTLSCNCFRVSTCAGMHLGIYDVTPQPYIKLLL